MLRSPFHAQKKSFVLMLFSKLYCRLVPVSTGKDRGRKNRNLSRHNKNSPGLAVAGLFARLLNWRVLSRFVPYDFSPSVC